MLPGVVAEAARRFGHRTAYVASSGERVSYVDLDRASDEVAGGLARRGVGPGDVVALVLPASPEFVLAYIGAAKLGATTAGVNARLTPAERAACLDTVAPAVVLDDAGDTGLAAWRVPGFEPPALPDDPERAIAIVFTSGTTGSPKAAVFGGRQLATVTQIDTAWRWGDAAVPGPGALAGTTFAHLGPMTKLPGVLVRGTTTHVLERWTPAAAIEAVARERIAALGGIPTQMALMLTDSAFASADLSCVQAVVMGGGPATPALVRAARAGFGAAVAVRYSCTEAGIGTGTALADPDEDAEVTVGRPQAGVELLVLDDDDRPVATGDVGAVCFRSPAVMTAYHGAPDATRAAFTATGAVRTGDLGWIDDAGRLRLVGRSKEAYVRGGENVFPMEVEAVLAEHGKVADVAVVARRDAVWGEVGVAFVVARDAGAPPTIDELRVHGRARLAAFKLPEAVVVVDALPRTPMEKVDRRALAELVASEDDVEA